MDSLRGAATSGASYANLMSESRQVGRDVNRIEEIETQLLTPIRNVDSMTELERAQLDRDTAALNLELVNLRMRTSDDGGANFATSEELDEAQQALVNAEQNYSTAYITQLHSHPQWAEFSETVYEKTPEMFP